MTLHPSSMLLGVISSSLSSFQIAAKSFSRSTLLTSFIADSSTGHLKLAWSCGGPSLTLNLMVSISSWETFNVSEYDGALAFRNADTTSPFISTSSTPRGSSVPSTVYTVGWSRKWVKETMFLHPLGRRRRKVVRQLRAGRHCVARRG